MNWIKRNLFVAACIAITGMALACATVYASGGGPDVLQVQKSINGKTYSEWSAASWQWGLALPPELNPVNPDADFDLATGQSGPVWFLGWPIDYSDGISEISVTVKKGKKIFLALLTAEASSLEPPPFFGGTEEEQRAAANAFMNDHVSNMACTIDGEAVEDMFNYRVQSPQFTFTAPTPWIFGATGGTGTAVSDGYFLMLEPFSTGEHTINITGRLLFTLAQDGFDLDLNIDATINVTAEGHGGHGGHGGHDD